MSNAVNKRVVLQKTASATGDAPLQGNKPINISGLSILANSASPNQLSSAMSGRARTSPQIRRKLDYDAPSTVINPQTPGGGLFPPAEDMGIPPPPPGFPFLNTGGYVSYGYVISAPYDSASQTSQIGDPIMSSTRYPEGYYSNIPSSVPTGSQSYWEVGGHSNLFDPSLIGSSPPTPYSFASSGGVGVQCKTEARLDQIGLDSTLQSSRGSHSPSSFITRSLPVGQRAPRSSGLHTSTQSAPPNYPMSLGSHVSNAESAMGYFASGSSRDRTLCEPGCNSSQCPRYPSF